MSSQKLTPEQAEESRALKRLVDHWQAQRKKDGLPWRQADLGLLLGGLTQGSVSQYVRGNLPLNARAVMAFANALGVPPSSISTRLAEEAARRTDRRLRGKIDPGMIYQWTEVTTILYEQGCEYLPDVFSVECPDKFLGGLIKRGDILSVSSRDLKSINTGDGLIFRRGHQIGMCIYRKGEGEDFYAQLSDGVTLYSGNTPIEILYAIEGNSTSRWSRYFK